MFVANSNPDFIAHQSPPTFRVGATVAPPKNWLEARDHLFLALKQCGFCDRKGRMTPHALSLMPELASPLPPAALDKLNALFRQEMKIDGKTLSVKSYLESLYPGILVQHHLKLTTYLRGSYAAYVIDPMTYLSEALEVFYARHPEVKPVIQHKFLEYKTFKPPLKEPNDADFADLFFHGSFHIPPLTLEKIRQVMLKWGHSLVQKNPFELNLIPVPNDITRTAEEIVISTLKNDDPQALKVDRIIGRLDNYCLFSRDNIYIDYRDTGGFKPFPLSMGLESSGQPYSFWQSILDREMNIIRLEPKHRNDFCAVLAAVEHYTKGAQIDESEVTLEEIYHSFLPCLTHDRLLKAVLKRIKDHSVDPLSYLFHFCNKIPEDFHIKRDQLWRETVKVLGAEKQLGKFPFLETNHMGFEAFRNELAHWMSQGFKDWGSHHFRIAPKQQDEMTQVQRHFRKMVLLDHKEGSSSGNPDPWMQGVKALHHPTPASVLSQEFMHQLVEDMTSHDVYNPEEIGRVLKLGETYFGAINPSHWLEGLLKSPYAKIVLPHWEKTQMAMAQDEVWLKLAVLLPSRFYPELLERFSQIFEPLDAESKVHFLIKAYPHLAEMDRSKGLDFLKQVTSSIGSISETTQKKWSAWASECIAKERQNTEALRLFLIFSRVCDLADLPKKQRDRIEYEIQALTPDQKSDYIEFLIERGDLFQAVHQLPKEASPLLDKALLRIPQITQKQFDDLMTYLDGYLQFFGGSWEGIVAALEITKQKRLLHALPLEIAENCKNLGLINEPILLHVMEKKFAINRSLALLWAIERANGHVDPKQSAQVLKSYQQAKVIALSDQAIADRLDWLLERHKYRDCFQLLEKVKSFNQRALWDAKCFKAFLENSSLDALNKHFVDDRLVDHLILPQGFLQTRFAQEEDLRACLTLYQKLKNCMSHDERSACVGLLLEKQRNKPLRSQRDQMHLLIECLPYLHTHAPLFCQVNGFEWMKSALSSKEASAVRAWLLDEGHCQRLIASDPSLGDVLLELYYVSKVQVPACLVDAALKALNTPNQLQEADYHRLLFNLLIDLAPSYIDRLNIDMIPLRNIFEMICRLVPQHFSLEQFWQLLAQLSSIPDDQLKLIKAWNSGSTLDGRILQQQVLKFAPTAKSLIPFLRWMDESQMEPIAEWDLHWRDFDESQLALFLNVYSRISKNRIAIIEQAILRKFSILCLKHAPQFIAELNEMSELQGQLQEMILAKAQGKKDWSLGEIESLLSCLEFLRDEPLMNAFKLCCFEALLSIREKDPEAEQFLMAWLEGFAEDDLFLLQLSPQGIQRLLKLLNTHYESVYNNADRYHVFFEKFLSLKSPTEDFVCKALIMWEGLHRKLRLELTLMYLSNHPQAIDRVVESLMDCSLQGDFTPEDFAQVAEGLFAQYPMKDFSITPLLQCMLYVKNAMKEKEFPKAAVLMFDFFTILTDIDKKGFYQFNQEPFFHKVIIRLMKYNAWDQVDLMFLRYVLFRTAPHQKVANFGSLESHFEQLRASDHDFQQVTIEFSEALLKFAQYGYQFIDTYHLAQMTENDYAGKLKQLNQAGLPIPEAFFPYYNPLNCWIALHLETYVKSATPEDVSKLTSAFIQILNLSWAHPAANQTSFEVFQRTIMAVMERGDCRKASVALLSSFLLIDSMYSVSQFKPDFKFMNIEPTPFAKFAQNQLMALMSLSKEQDSYINQLRVFKFIIYLSKEHPQVLVGQESQIKTFLDDFKEKLPNRSPDFHREMLTYVHESVRILRNSRKYSESQLMRFCKSLEAIWLKSNS